MIRQAAFTLLAGAGLAAVLWRTGRQTGAPGRIVLAGAALHAAATAAVFSVSWFNLPILTRHHSGDGFWHLASDARAYYRISSLAALHGLDQITDNIVSPLFFKALAIWMALTGVHPAAPLLLNFAVYLGTCALIVRIASPAAAPRPPDLAVAVPLVALSGAPLLLLSSTQILKDMTFACAIAVTLLGIRALLRRIGQDTPWPAVPRLAAPALLWLGLGVYVLAGIRPYYGIFVGAALAIALTARVVFDRRCRTMQIAALSVVTLLVVWLGVVQGAAQYYPYYRDAAKSTLDALTGRVFSPLLAVTSPVRAPNWNASAPIYTPSAQTMRDGFAMLGGDTTFAKLDSEPRTASRGARVRQIVQGTAIGVAAIFVPITLLKAMGIVEIEGGRGLLFVTDLDTLFLDATAIAVAWVLIRERRALGRDRAYLCVCLVLFALVTLMLGYVVTNFGLLARLRVIAFVPLWMATLAISRTQSESAARPPAATAVRTGVPEARSV